VSVLVDSEFIQRPECHSNHKSETVHARPGRISWVRSFKRVFDIDMQHCPHCGAEELLRPRISPDT
jgi:hypothetical protein